MNCPSCDQEIVEDVATCPHCESAIAADSGAGGDESSAPAAVEHVEDVEEAGGGSSSVCGYGRYEVLRTIGQGGMGAIYEAVDTKLKIHVARKRLLPVAEEQEAGLERFLREAEAIAVLKHITLNRIYGNNARESS